MRNLFSSDFVQGECCRAPAAITATATTAIVAREADTAARSDSYLVTTFTVEKSSSNLMPATIESVETAEELQLGTWLDLIAAA